MDALLKRALIKVNPHYFSMDENVRLKYRLNMSGKELDNIKTFIIEKLFNLEVTNPDALDDMLNELSTVDTTKFNAVLQPIFGIGEDLFFLNEYFPEGVDITHFATLYDYDYKDYLFQESERVKMHDNYQKQNYRGRLYSCWARLIINKQFTYATLDLAASYIFSQLEAFGYEYIDHLIPHEFLRGKNDGKKDGDYYELDLKIDANGKEAQLDELNERFIKYIAERYEYLLDIYDQENINKVYIFNESKENDPMHNFIFTDKNVLKEIRLEYFVKSCREYESVDHGLLCDRQEKEKEGLKLYLDEQYQDVMDNFDANVLMFKKKTRVMIHDDAGLDS